MLQMINRQEGFTLLEALIAVVILGIGLSILVEGFLIVTNTIEYQRYYNYLLHWSAGKINEISSGSELARHGEFEYCGRLFQWSVEERNQYSEGSSGLKSISLVIEWQGSINKRTFSISRVII